MEVVVVTAGERDSLRLGSFEIPEDVFSVCKIFFGWVRRVLGKDVGDRGDVQSGGCSEPIKGSNNRLEFVCEVLLFGKWVVRVLDFVDW